MRTTHRTLLVAVLAVVMLGLVSCFSVPLGDPEKSKVQEQYIGAWRWDGSGQRHLAIIRPWDERTYHVQFITINDQEGGRVEQAILKGWLTTVEDETFFTLQDVQALAPLPGEEAETRYLVLRLQLASDRLIATSLNPSFPPFEGIVSPEEFARLIAEHQDDRAMWAEQPITARRAQAEELAAFAKARDDAAGS